MLLNRKELINFIIKGSRTTYSIAICDTFHTSVSDVFGVRAFYRYNRLLRVNMHVNICIIALVLNVHIYCI